MSDTSSDNQLPVHLSRGQQLHELYQVAAIPYSLRLGPIDHDYGRQARQDSIHASCLREVQNLSALRARLTEGRPSKALTKVELTRLDLTYNALHGARLDAAREGVPMHDINAAEAAGNTGTPWVHEPGHQYLGRIEQLADDLEQAHDLIVGQKQTIAELGTQTARDARRISDLEQRLDREHGLLAHAWALLEDSQRETGADSTPAPLPDWMNLLPAQATEAHTGTEPDLAGTGAEPGQAMGAAIEALDDSTGTWSPDDRLPAPRQISEAGTGPEVGQ